jgi:hypothetical protein
LSQPGGPVAESRLAAVVNYVLDAAQRPTSGARPVVDLNFSFGHTPAEQLGVRVEFRGGVVQTTFRTGSAELRGALTTVWHDVAPQHSLSASGVRLNDPVFAAAPASTAFSGHAFADGRRQPPPQADDRPAGFRPPSADDAAGTASSPTANSGQPAWRPATALHLHAIA